MEPFTFGPNVVGLKDGIGDVDLMTRIVTSVRGSGHPRAAEFLFLNGLPTAEVSARAYRAIGVRIYSSAVHCFAPNIAHTFHRALSTGDDVKIEAVHIGGNHHRGGGRNPRRGHDDLPAHGAECTAQGAR